MNKKYSKKKIKYRKNKTFRNVHGGDITVDMIEYKIKENCPNEENSKKLANIETILKYSKPMFSEKFKKQLKNSLKSLKNISSSPKYVFSLLANLSNVHRILFKNAYFIEFIKFEHILKLYCGEPKKIYRGKELPEKCVVLKKGYLFSKDKEVVANSEKETESEKHTDETAIANVLNIDDEVKENKKEEEYDIKKFIDEGFERLDFSKLNNALLTDDFKIHDEDNYYISFYPRYICLFEYLHTFKYQFHRMLWSGGMFDWTYILDETKELLDNNDDLHREFRKYNGLEKHDKYLGKFQEIYNNGGEVVQSVIDKDCKIDEENLDYIEKDFLDIHGAVEKVTRKVKKATPKNKGGDIRVLNKVKNIATEVVESIAKQTVKNVNKYMIMRKLLQYYDIDPKKYNMNLLKTTGILKKNYPLFMEIEARIALITANACLTEDNQTNENIKYRYNEISGGIEYEILNNAKYSLDVLIDELIAIQKNKNKGGYPMKNKTRKYYKGGILFTNVLNDIFKQCSRLMVEKQLTKIEILIIDEPRETIPVAKFISDVMGCAINSNNILCSTLANVGLLPFLPGGTPHCILSNIAAILVLYKLDYLGRRDIIKTGKFDIKNTKEQGLETDDESEQDSESEIDIPNISTKSNTSDISIKSNEHSIKSMLNNK
jgi:hypothetical protein